MFSLGLRESVQGGGSTWRRGKAPCEGLYWASEAIACKLCWRAWGWTPVRACAMRALRRKDAQSRSAGEKGGDDSGGVSFRRSVYHCANCGRSCCPGDAVLGIEDSAFSPGLRWMMSRAGSQSCFAQAEQDLLVYAGVHVDSKSVERVCKQVGGKVQAWVAQENAEILGEAQEGRSRVQQQPVSTLYVEFDATGLPARPEELEGRKGKQPDGTSKTRQAKLGCVFTQTAWDDEGRPVRDPNSTTYVGNIESSEDFGWRIYAEALRRGLQKASTVVVLTDGTNYNHTIVQTHFPNAIQIIDLFHAREHLYEISRLLLSQADRPSHEKLWLELLD